MIDWEAIKPLLTAKLDPANVRKPSGSFGPKGDYIEGWHAIAEANRIFGFGEWSYTIKSMTQDHLGKADVKDQWEAAYTCIITVTVGDVVREDVGFGSGFAKKIGDAVEGATKEAATDALKRALRTFGNAFGLALYDKSRENVGVDAPQFDSAGAAQRIINSIGKKDNVDELKAFWNDEKPTTDKMTDADFDRAKTAFLNRGKSLTQADAA